MHANVFGRMSARGKTWADRKDLALGRVVRDVLKRHGGNRTRAARTLAIDRTHLQRLIERYGLKGEC